MAPLVLAVSERMEMMMVDAEVLAADCTRKGWTVRARVPAINTGTISVFSTQTQPRFLHAADPDN